MGGEVDANADAFLGNMGTKIFHANGDPETNKWAFDIISEELQARTNWHGTTETGQGRGGGSKRRGVQGAASESPPLKRAGRKTALSLKQSFTKPAQASLAMEMASPGCARRFPSKFPA